MITFQNLKMTLGSNLIFDNVNFSIEDFAKVGVVGVNGAGKSTLFHLIKKDLEPDSGLISFSSRFVDVSFMPQELSPDIFLKTDETVIDFIKKERPIEKFQNEINDKWEIIARTQSGEERNCVLKEINILQDGLELLCPYTAEVEMHHIFNGMGISHFDLTQSVSSLSGGEKSKIAFAKTLYSRHNILLLDEPTNHLDSSSKKWLIKFLSESKKTVLVISHDTEFLDAFSRKILFVDKARKNIEIYRGNYYSFLQQKKEKERSISIKVKKENEKELKVKVFIQSMQGVSGKRKRQAKSREKILEKQLSKKEKHPPKLKKVKIDIIHKKESGKFPLTVNCLSFSFGKNSNFLFKNLSFSQQRGERVAVAGKNGAGKTTLLKILAGKINCSEGDFVYGKNVIISFFSQEHNELSLDLNVLDEFLKSTSFTNQQARSFLGRFLFQEEKVFQLVGTLSPGEKSRLRLAKTISSGANFLLLDEPTNHLDPTTKNILAEALVNFQGSILIVSHEVDFLKTIGVSKTIILTSEKK